MRHPERAQCSVALPCSGCEAKDLLRCASGQPIPQAVLDSPTVQRSRSFGFAETVSKHFAVRVARLRMARPGVRWTANRDVCIGYSNSGNGSRIATSFQSFFQNIFFPKKKICRVSHERNRGNSFLKKISFQAKWRW